MKYLRLGPVVGIAALLLALVGLTACGSSSSSSSTESSSSVAESGNEPSESSQPASSSSEESIDVTMLNIGSVPYTDKYIEVMKEQAKKHNINLKILNGEFESAVQAQQVETVISEKPDDVIIFPADSKAIIPSMARLKEAGIPVTITNSQVEESGIQYEDAFTGPDNYKQGIEQAKQINEALGGKGKIAVIELFKGSAPNVERLEGLEEGLQELNSKIEIVAQEPGEGDQATAKNVTSDLLTRFGSELNGIVAQDDVMGAGVAEAVTQAGFKGKIMVTGNGAEKNALIAIENGEMYGTLVQSPTQDATLAVEAANAIARGESYPKTTYLEITPVTKKNVASITPEW
jgi:ribose transport system substrate-binding protein